MTQKTPHNRLKILINKIAVEAGDMDKVSTIISELARECKVIDVSVKRWMNNTNQPSTSDLTRIISVLNKYDSLITYSDFFGPVPQPSTHRVKKSPLVK